MTCCEAGRVLVPLVRTPPEPIIRLSVFLPQAVFHSKASHILFPWQDPYTLWNPKKHVFLCGICFSHILHYFKGGRFSFCFIYVCLNIAVDRKKSLCSNLYAFKGEVVKEKTNKINKHMQLSHHMQFETLLSFQKVCRIHFFFWRSEHDVTYHSQTLIGCPDQAWCHILILTSH